MLAVCSFGLTLGVSLKVLPLIGGPSAGAYDAAQAPDRNRQP